MRRLALSSAVLSAGLLISAACGSSDTGSEAAAGGSEPVTGANVVVTTGILGDVVTQMLDGAAAVTVLMPPGADPHDFQLSARQAAELREADALVTNGAGFEEGMLDALAAAEADGVAIHEAISAVETLEGGHDHSHGEEGHGEEEGEHSEGDGHSHDEEDEPHSDETGGEEGGTTTEPEGDGHSDEGGEEIDPHFFTDPERMAAAAAGIRDFLLAEIPALDTPAVASSSDALIAELEGLAAEVDETLAPIAPEDRVMVTNHEVFSYFADRFAFEVVGVIVPGGGTQGEADARQLAQLAEVIRDEGVRAVFADVSSPQSLADTLADEAGGEVEVVALFTESLGEEGSGGETYQAMVRTNAERIAAALA